MTTTMTIPRPEAEIRGHVADETAYGARGPTPAGMKIDTLYIRTYGCSQGIVRALVKVWRFWIG